MELRSFSVERYKGYAEPAVVDVAPLTILVGANNSGKTVLAKAIQLLAGGLAPSDKDPAEPLPLESGGVHHGEAFEDLVTRRPVHGWLKLSAALVDDSSKLSLSATVQNVVTPPRPSERQISNWSLRRGDDEVELNRQGFDEQSSYAVSISGAEQTARQIGWRGLIPRQPDKLADWVGTQVNAIRAWASGVHYLQCPRSLRPSPFLAVDHRPQFLGSRGQAAPLVLAADGKLRECVRKWYRTVFGVSLDVVAQGSYSELVVGMPASGGKVQLIQSGRGISNVLPIVVTALMARKAGPGVDIIEHPAAELHPAAHADIAELLLDNLAGPARPLIVETHSEMLLLRARRWIAEGRLPAENVLVYWVYTHPERGSILQKIRIDERGAMSGWPAGVFIEDYEEILAIRRAARRDG